MKFDFDANLDCQLNAIDAVVPHLEGISRHPAGFDLVAQEDGALIRRIGRDTHAAAILRLESA